MSLQLPLKSEIKASMYLTIATMELTLDNLRRENNKDNEDDEYQKSFKKAFIKMTAQMNEDEYREMMIWFFKKNATIISYYKLYDYITKTTDLDIGNLLIERSKGEKSLIGYYDFIHNPIASILVDVGSPVYTDYALKFHDCNGLIRLVQLKRLIKVNHIPPDKIGQFLKDKPKEYGDPYTGQPLKWDAKRKVISFKPVSDKSKPFDYEIAIY
jgi:hypothetical protein